MEHGKRPVVCSTGRPSLGQDADRALFAESAGTCLICNNTLFPSDPKRMKSISIAERAHVVAHSDDGPRADPGMPQDLRDDPSNLVLLCPSCHTKADKDPESHPADVLLRAKAARRNAISLIGGTPCFSSRAESRRAVGKLLLKNRVAFREMGPNSEDGAVASDEHATLWSECVLREIVPNNRLIVAIVEINEDLAADEEIEIAELLRHHTDALENKHLGRLLAGPAPRFPEQAELLFKDVRA
ncbi:HNH endonuclease [Kitasatospora sp. NPDC056651]|uniref:HNH endonuclease n=1 Tax=Kitasatospora sp. NPDC056651 TaxID=3345892 RepID=UPI0036C3BCC5